MKETNKTDQELVLAAQKGDKSACDQLVSRYHYRISLLVSRFISDPQEAKDVTQEVFMRVFCAIQQFRGESAFYTWLYRVSVNIIKNYLFHEGRQPTTIDLNFDDLENRYGITLLKDNTTPEALLISDEVKNRIFDVVDHMNEDIRLAFVLREMEGFSYEDIADILDCKLGTVRSRLFRARVAIDKEVSHLLRS